MSNRLQGHWTDLCWNGHVRGMSRVHEITQIFRELSRGRPGLHAGHGTGLQTQGGSHHQAGQNTHIEGHGHHREPLHTPYTHDSH